MLKERLQECFRARSAITQIASLSGDMLALSSEFHGIKIFSDCQVTHNISHELLGHKTTATAFSKELHLLAFANATTIYVLNLKSKEILQTIRTDDGVIEILSFVPNSPYLVAGTKEGRVMQYRYDGRSQLSRLCSFPTQRVENLSLNYVSAIAFEGEMMACSGYGGSITILKINSQANKMTLQASQTRINALTFLDQERLLSGGADGILRVHRLQKSQESLSINTPFVNIKSILKLPNPNLVLICANSNKLALVDVENAKLIAADYLTFSSEVQMITLHQNRELYVALQDGRLYRLALTSTQRLKDAIANGSLKEAFELLEQDAMLQNSKEHTRVELLFDRIKLQAIEHLVRSQTLEAKALLESFRELESKREEVEAIFRDFDHYVRFKLLVIQKKYPLAYAMSEKFGSLKRTPQFHKMEEHFSQAYGFAQKQILIGRKDLAEELLNPYITTLSKKPIINLLLKQNREFIEFLRSIAAKDYVAIERLRESHPLFEQIPSYISLKRSEDERLQKIENLIKNSKIQEALEEIKSIFSTISNAQRLKELYNFAQQTQKLKTEYEKGNLLECYVLLDTHANLQSLKLAQALEQEWAKVMQECESYALRGDIKAIKTTLGDLIKTPSRLGKIGDLLRVSFHTKIKMLLAKRSFVSAQNILYSYIEIFGSDSEIRTLITIYEHLAAKKFAIVLEERHKIGRNDWIYSPLLITPSNLQ